ncbi:hypothetical protein FQA39_LY03955 [Lamprigera yunnana]|nr:hypothetical protein FQA39_LY03955 [Lamprigera yunnana]
MPLPAALAAKLAKRGLYTVSSQRSSDKDRRRDYRGVTGCPNKSNIYHDCSYWCELHWKPSNSPDSIYIRNVGKLLLKYPLPHNWTEVFDKGMKRYYYWDMETDLVSWLPPKHPKAKPSQSAAKLRERRVKGVEDRAHKGDDEKGDRKRHSRSSRRDRDDSDRRHKHDDKDHGRKRSRREEIIDPMDPAAYSDVPIGTWSDGLESNKSDADSTASGALYQQRPYPAPGDILAANKSKSKR